MNQLDIQNSYVDVYSVILPLKEQENTNKEADQTD